MLSSTLTREAGNEIKTGGVKKYVRHPRVSEESDRTEYRVALVDRRGFHMWAPSNRKFFCSAAGGTAVHQQTHPSRGYVIARLFSESVCIKTKVHFRAGPTPFSEGS